MVRTNCPSPGRAGLGPRHYTVHLRAILLLQFMEHLDKLMYNAYEGSCVTLPPVPKVGSVESEGGDGVGVHGADIETLSVELKLTVCF